MGIFLSTLPTTIFALAYEGLTQLVEHPLRARVERLRNRPECNMLLRLTETNASSESPELCADN